MRTYIFCVLILSSCSQESVSNYIGFEEYVAVYDSAAVKYSSPNRPIYIEFTNLRAINPDIVGLCSNGKIYIDQTSWSIINHIQREIIILHELGHCLLNKEHTNSGIMYPYLVNYSQEYWNNNRDRLIADLFRR